jgi:hypothetical protein
MRAAAAVTLTLTTAAGTPNVHYSEIPVVSFGIRPLAPALCHSESGRFSAECDVQLWRQGASSSGSLITVHNARALLREDNTLDLGPGDYVLELHQCRDRYVSLTLCRARSQTCSNRHVVR